MRIAALYDIHGNLPALDAVLAEVRQADVDQIVVGGDVLPGPMPRETVARLKELDVPVHIIQGNGDREVLAIVNGNETGAVPEQYRESMEWVARQLLPEQVQWMTTWPKTLRVVMRGFGDVLFCHATPPSDTDVFTRSTPSELLRPMFDATGVRLVICGHTHMQFDRMVGNVRVVNAGSVGMPFGEPGASWLLLDPTVQLRHTTYDLQKAAARIRATGYPLAEDFAARNVLEPPAEAEMLELFTRVAMKQFGGDVALIMKLS